MDWGDLRGFRWLGRAISPWSRRRRGRGCLWWAHGAQIYVDLLLCFFGLFAVSSDGVY